MSFNEQLGSGNFCTCLLEWINIQKKQLGIEGYLFSFNQAIEEGCLYSILKTIDSAVFQYFEVLQSKQKMDIIEKYLDMEFGKRMKWSFKKSFDSFSSQQNFKQFAKLLCYFSIHSKRKNQFINRILTLSQQSQNNLMNLMQSIELKLQNIVQVKEILQQIQYLQSQNQELKKKLQQMNKTNNQLLSLVNQSQTQNAELKNQVQKFKQQKIQVFSTLKIDFISEYIQIYNRLKAENQRNLDAIKKLQYKLQESQINAKELNQRIKCDCTVINNLSEDITRLKQIVNYYQNKFEYDQWSKESDEKQHILKSLCSRSSHKQNLTRCSITTMAKSMEVPTQWMTLFQNDEEILGRSSLRGYNNQLISKLQNVQSRNTQLSSQVKFLQQKVRNLKDSRKNLKQIIKLAKLTHEQFQFKYKVSENQIKARLNKQIRITQ